MKIVRKLILLLFVVITLHAAEESLELKQENKEEPGKLQTGLQATKQQFIENNLRALEDLEQRKTLKLLRDHVEKGNIEFSENIEAESEKLFKAEQEAQKIRLSSKSDKYEAKRRKQEDDEQRKVLKKLRDHVEHENIVFTEFLEGDLDIPAKAPLSEFQKEQVVEKALEANSSISASDYQKRAARVQRRQALSALKLLELEEKKKRSEQLDYAYKSGRYAFLYKVPTWPLQALAHNKPDLIDIRASYQEAVRMYSASGTKQNVSGIPFGQDQITVKDVFFASKLFSTHESLLLKTSTNSNPNPIEFLKDQVVVFDGWYSNLSINVGYSRNLHEGDFSFGFNLPIVRRQNSLRFAVRLDDEAQSNVNLAKNQQLEDYGGTAEGYLLDVMNKKGIAFNGNEAASGLGDLTLFGTLQIYSSRCERILIGANFIFPTAQNRDTTKLWAPELGNGGFYGASMYASLLGARTPVFNPHLFTQATYYFATPVTRRVSRYIKKAATQTVSTNSFDRQDEFTPNLLTAEKIYDLDSVVRGFADTSSKVTIKKGFEFNLEVGNLFERFLFRQGFLDLFYKFNVKSADSLGSAVAEDVYDVTALFKNSMELSHQLGFEHTYQFDRNVRSKLGVRYTLGGRNCPELFEVTAALTTEF